MPKHHREVPTKQVRWVGTTAIMDLRQTRGHPDSRGLVRAMFAVLRKGADRIVVNLKEVGLLYDDIPCGLMSFMARVGDRKVTVCLCCLSENAQELLKITNLDTLFDVFATEEDALGWAGPAEQ